MRNIWFTIYTGSIDKYSGIANYRTMLEILLVPAIQDKINREKKIQKYMIMFSDDIVEDNLEHFKELHYEKKIRDGIVNLYISTKGINWNNLSEQERKDFLIEKWKVLFSNLSDDYFVTDKFEVIQALDELKDKEWKITSSLFKKKLKYNKESYSIVMDLSTAKAELALISDSDEKWIKLKEYETWKIMTDASFKKFKLEGDVLTFENSHIFGSPEVFDLKEFIQ